MAFWADGPTGRALFGLGQLALARKDSTASREHFSAALAAFEEMGALPRAKSWQARNREASARLILQQESA